MIDLKRILLPTDFSEFSRVAVDWGCSFAEVFGAELHLLHVQQDLVAMVPEPGLSFAPPADYQRELQEAAERALAQLPGTACAENTPVVRAIRQGPPFVEIIRYARENDVDLIIMGTHGRSGLAHMLMGSVAERVVRKSPCPVLTIRPAGHEFQPP